MVSAPDTPDHKPIRTVDAGSATEHLRTTHSITAPNSDHANPNECVPISVGPAPQSGTGCEAARTTNRAVRSTMPRTLPNHRSFAALRRLLDHLRCNHIDHNFPRAPVAYKVAKDDVASEKAKVVCGGEPKPTVLHDPWSLHCSCQSDHKRPTSWPGSAGRCGGIRNWRCVMFCAYNPTL